MIVGELTRRVYEGRRKESASLRIQRDWRMHVARAAYKKLHFSAISIQTGMRGMAARNELRFRRQTKAAIVIQVRIFTIGKYILRGGTHFLMAMSVRTTKSNHIIENDAWKTSSKYFKK